MHTFLVEFLIFSHFLICNLPGSILCVVSVTACDSEICNLVCLFVFSTDFSKLAFLTVKMNRWNLLIKYIVLSAISLRYFEMIYCIRKVVWHNRKTSEKNHPFTSHTQSYCNNIYKILIGKIGHAVRQKKHFLTCKKC